MAYRSFRDSRGTQWETWDVVPRLAERRSAERRVERVRVDVDRRKPSDRRMIVGRRPVLSAGLNSGWLCFDSQAEKRRLAPVPLDWQRCSDNQLERYLDAASPVGRVSILPDGQLDRTG